MNNQNQGKTFNERFKNSVSMKISTITVLVLILLIPMNMIKSIIKEREQQREKAIKEVSNKWASKQTILGPVLTIPMTYEITHNDKSTDVITKYIHVLPEEINYKTTIEPKKLNRGIYEIVVYQSNLKTNGTFIIPDLNSYTDSGVKQIQLDKAFVSIGISDLKGIKNRLTLNWDGDNKKIEPGTKVNFIDSGITIPINNLSTVKSKTFPFNMDMKLQGSQSISFVPVGNTTTVAIESPWDSPSFFGNFLPDTRDISKKGFNATWNVLELNRNFSQIWTSGNDQENKFKNSAFGVNLKLPMDDYQKTMRSAKYAIMTLTLTFITFFLVEVLNKKKIHPLQYILVGAALCIFYILLISISEHSNFNVAYLISSTAVISLITLYSFSVIKKFKISMLVLFILITIYSFVFVILQLADYALLMGSIGLIVILGITMYSTRNINWYTINFDNSTKN